MDGGMNATRSDEAFRAEVSAWMRAHLVDSAWTERVLFMALSIAAGVLTSHAIERPFLRLRSKWLPAAR